MALIRRPATDSPISAAAVLSWVTVRLVVAALCLAALLAVAQLTVDGLLAYLAAIPPYTGAG